MHRDLDQLASQAAHIGTARGMTDALLAHLATPRERNPFAVELNAALREAVDTAARELGAMLAAAAECGVAQADGDHRIMRLVSNRFGEFLHLVRHTPQPAIIAACCYELLDQWRAAAPHRYFEATFSAVPQPGVMRAMVRGMIDELEGELDSPVARAITEGLTTVTGYVRAPVAAAASAARAAQEHAPNAQQAAADLIGRVSRNSR